MMGDWSEERRLRQQLVTLMAEMRQEIDDSDIRRDRDEGGLVPERPSREYFAGGMVLERRANRLASRVREWLLEASLANLSEADQKWGL